MQDYEYAKELGFDYLELFFSHLRSSCPMPQIPGLKITRLQVMRQKS